MLRPPVPFWTKYSTSGYTFSLASRPSTTQAIMSHASAPISSICVYCGSADNVPAAYYQAARDIGRAIAQRGYVLIYGGGSTGLMGAVADAALEAGGDVIGVIPEHFYTPKLAHDRLTRLEIVPDMHTRKARMAELADAFIALPGGYGTLEEFFEILTWAQIGLHAKPIGLFNFEGYYDGLLAFLRHAQQQGFIFPEHGNLFVHAHDADVLLEALENYRHPGGVSRWLREED